VSKKRVAGLSAAVVVAGMIAAGVAPSIAQQPPPPIAAEFLSGRAAFPDDVDMRIESEPRDREDDGDRDPRAVIVRVDDPTYTVVARFTVQPGAEFPWHTHPGPVFVNVVEGTLVYVAAEGCRHRRYPAGTAFVDPGHGHVHSAFNPSATVETVFVATFFEAPPGTEPLLIPADAPPGCVL
jgi:quercetin dioxygenase-like cupin family protein